ncbi:hypothetical protein LCGC14_2691540 [marine sediment metagenome]|uniref:Zinc-ribbon domain-containing protein n=1 Tax=marine sediment metagenome TaxID=412755 RepID=A0A0F9BT34_9ZZZZ
MIWCKKCGTTLKKRFVVCPECGSNAKAEIPDHLCGDDDLGKGLPPDGIDGLSADLAAARAEIEHIKADYEMLSTAFDRGIISLSNTCIDLTKAEAERDELAALFAMMEKYKIGVVRGFAAGVQLWFVTYTDAFIEYALYSALNTNGLRETGCHSALAALRLAKSVIDAHEAKLKGTGQ